MQNFKQTRFCSGDENKAMKAVEELYKCPGGDIFAATFHWRAVCLLRDLCKLGVLDEIPKNKWVSKQMCCEFEKF